MAEITVPGAYELKDGQTRSFEFSTDFPSGPRKREGFVLSYRGQLLAFLNECPHWAVELDLGDGHFYDEELERIYCKNHGALFVLPSGQCETGPCLGRSLTPLSLRVDGRDVVVQV